MALSVSLQRESSLEVFRASVQRASTRASSTLKRDRTSWRDNWLPAPASERCAESAGSPRDDPAEVFIEEEARDEGREKENATKMKLLRKRMEAGVQCRGGRRRERSQITQTDARIAVRGQRYR